MVCVKWYINWQPYSYKHFSIVLCYFLCLLKAGNEIWHRTWCLHILDQDWLQKSLIFMLIVQLTILEWHDVFNFFLEIYWIWWVLTFWFVHPWLVLVDKKLYLTLFVCAFKKKLYNVASSLWYWCHLFFCNFFCVLLYNVLCACGFQLRIIRRPQLGLCMEGLRF